MDRWIATARRCVGYSRFLLMAFALALPLRVAAEGGPAAESGTSPEIAEKKAEFMQHLEQAREHYKQKRFADAAREYDAALAIAPGYGMGHTMKGYSLFYSMRPEEALVAFNEAARITPDSFRMLFGRGLTLNALRRFGEAAESLERACELEPGRANHWHLLGLARLYNMQPDLALAAFDRLLALSPQRVDAHTLKGVALFDLARYDEALASFDLALKINPKADDAWMSRGSSLLKLGRADEALRSYDRALSGNPLQAEGLYNRAEALLVLGRRDEAAQSLTKALAVRADFSKARTLLDALEGK